MQKPTLFRRLPLETNYHINTRYIWPFAVNALSGYTLRFADVTALHGRSRLKHRGETVREGFWRSVCSVIAAVAAGLTCQ